MGGGVPPPVSGPPAAPAPQAAGPALAEASVAKLPERLQELPRAVVLTGTVAGETPEGLTRVRTQAGEVLLKSPVPLPADKPVTLQISPGQPAPRALVLANAPATTAPAPAPAAGAAAQPAVLLTTLLTGAATPAGGPAVTPNAAAAQPLQPGALVPAQVLAAAPRVPTPPGGQPAPLPAPQAGLPAQPAATPAPVPMAGTAAPPPPAPAGGKPAAPATAPTAGSPAAPAPTGGAVPTGGSATHGTPVSLGGDAAHPGAETPSMPAPSGNATPPATAAPPPVLAQGGTLALKILSVKLPGAQPAPDVAPQSQPGTAPAPNATAEPPPGAPVLSGTIAGSTPQGQPVLATRQGMLALNTQASLPPGTQVTAAVADRAAAAPAAPPGEPELIGAARDWPTLRQVMVALAGADRALAQSLLNTVLPQPNRKLGAALSFFLSAVRGGDARGWLGEEATSALEKAGRGDLLKQLEEEFRSMQRQSAEPLPGDWRPYTVPMFDGQAIHPVRVHVHPLNGDEEGNAQGEREAGSRFLIDVELSRLGPMQLDGMVRERRFDLILRSQNALPAELRAELTQVFADSVDAVGYGGGITFQAGPRGWVKLARAGRATLGVTA
ncbi:hypothetical protein [Azospirillum sp.]|uniref:hypothetical protein n=1 Tax=Azospirillum sp. TaxID=34012 RepID=UPI002D47E1B8|nr:hypothetical protein [Azospirillum sp.]HYD65685.1 hypothetical protein [Azospirillum sp.]